MRETNCRVRPSQKAFETTTGSTTLFPSKTGTDASNDDEVEDKTSPTSFGESMQSPGELDVAGWWMVGSRLAGRSKDGKLKGAALATDADTCVNASACCRASPQKTGTARSLVFPGLSVIFMLGIISAVDAALKLLVWQCRLLQGFGRANTPYFYACFEKQQRRRRCVRNTTRMRKRQVAKNGHHFHSYSVSRIVIHGLNCGLEPT